MAVPEGVIRNERLVQRAAQLDVDLLAIQEVDYFQQRSHQIDQTVEIADAMDAKYHSRAFAITGTPGEKWEKFSGSVENGGCYYGNGIISRIPIVEEFRLELGRSRIGAPLVIPQSPPGKSTPKMKLIYLSDEPRVAHAVYLQNGITVINTHLSFVPGMNAYQLRKIRHWADTLPGKKILVGDLNLPGKLPERIMKWRSAASQFTYPSWGAKLQFDHILLSTSEIKVLQKLEFAQPVAMVSDHLPLGVEISLE